MRAVLLACVALLALSCGKLGGPKTYKEAMDAAKAAHAASDHEKVHRLCARALELADHVGNGSQAVWALECYADAASRLGKVTAPPSAYATVIDTYPKDLSSTVGSYRLRNDYAVALYAAGKEDQAIAALEAALAYNKGTPRAGWNTVWERMYIVRNLGKLYAKKGTSKASTAFASEWAEEIEAQIGRSGNSYSMRAGAGPTLEVLANVLSPSDPARAGRLRTVAAEEREGEAQAGARKRCHQVGVLGTRLERCFLELP